MSEWFDIHAMIFDIYGNLIHLDMFPQMQKNLCSVSVFCIVSCFLGNNSETVKTLSYFYTDDGLTN